MRAFFLLFLLISCGDTNFKKVEELKGFRILGILASSPEVTPGGTSNLQLIVSDVNGGGRVITGDYESCIDPGVAQGANVSCSHDPSAVSGSYTIDTAGDADLGAANMYTGIATQAVSVTVSPIIFTGRSSRDQFNGVSYITIFRFNVDGQTMTAFKRVTATNRGTLNSNPTINDLQLNGVSMSTKPQKDQSMLVLATPPESYDYINVDDSTETRQEQLNLAWYVSSGELDKPKSFVNEKVKYLSDTPSAGMVILVILRDERGGLSLHKEIFP